MLHAYLEWGDDCVSYLRGMFTFAIWDSKDKQLFAARDRLGIKPFYYSTENESLSFSCEIQSLLKHPKIDAKLDMEGVDGFLAFGSVPASKTIIEGINVLPPGCLIQYSVGENSPNIEKYWDMDYSGKDSPSPSEVRSLIQEAVTMRLRSDVPVGAFLSGGLDSTSVVASMQAADRDADVRTFSISFNENEYSEGDAASAIASKLNTTHKTHIVTGSAVRENMFSIIKAMDQPTVDGVNTYFVSEIAANSGLRVALSGVGGDEVFGGYHTFKMIPQLETIARVTSLLPDSVSSFLASSFPGKHSWRSFISTTLDLGLPTDVQEIHGWLQENIEETKTDVSKERLDAPKDHLKPLGYFE